MHTLRKSLWVPLFSAALLCLILGCSSNDSGQKRPLTAQETRGEKVFHANCAVCHQATKSEALNGPSLMGLYKKQTMPSGTPATDARVRDVIVYGKRMMPGFNMALDDQQVNDLIAYLHTL